MRYTEFVKLRTFLAARPNRQTEIRRIHSRGLQQGPQRGHYGQRTETAGVAEMPRCSAEKGGSCRHNMGIPTKT